MDPNSLSQTALVVFAGFAVAWATLLLWSMLPVRRAPQPVADTPPEIVFLFADAALVDASAAALRLLGELPGNGSEISRLLSFLIPRFSNLPVRDMATCDCPAFDRVSDDGRSRIVVEMADIRMRLALEDLVSDPSDRPDRFVTAARGQQIECHRQLEDQSPAPAWRQSPEGRVLWANAAYRSLADRLGGNRDTEGAAAPVFGLPDHAALLAGGARRVKVDAPDGSVSRWFDCHAWPVGNDVLVTALPADAVVNAERTLRDFVQTLTQTFAHLSIGLAVFDHRRELTLFNPALTDLMAVPSEFLISRPTLSGFLDQLRERRMIPEPRDYRSWRHQLSDLEAAATDGRYLESWALADGRTLRVTGQPHPRGAVAFLFEDISAEISLARHFRTELETAQAVMDSLEEAIAVFSPAGILTISNRSYAALWGFDPSITLNELSIVDATRRWQQNCTPTPVWGDAREFMATIGDRMGWAANVRLRDGRQLACRFEPLPGGATLAGFSETATTALESLPARPGPVSA